MEFTLRLDNIHQILIKVLNEGANLTCDDNKTRPPPEGAALHHNGGENYSSSQLVTSSTLEKSLDTLKTGEKL